MRRLGRTDRCGAPRTCCCTLTTRSAALADALLHSRVQQRSVLARVIYCRAMARPLPFPLLVACCACFGRCCDGWELTLPGGCSAAPAGCVKDCTNGGEAGTPRVLPYCVGTAGSGEHADCGLTCERPNGLKAPPADPPCDSSKMSNEYCAAICWAYLSASPEYDGVVYAGTQAGTQCWCGFGQDFSASRGAVEPSSACSIACPAGGSAAAGEKCGGLCISSVTKIDCSAGGWMLVAVILGGAAVYLGVGGGWRKQHGAKGLDLLPHRAFWLDVSALVSDGIAFSKGRRAGGGSRDRGGGGPGAGAGAGYTPVREGGGSRERSGAPGGGGDGGREGDVGKKERAAAGNKSRHKEKKKEKKEKQKDKGEERTGVVAPVAPAPAVAAAAAAPGTGSGTAAGDGGRWVHVPAG